jgi:hypothetical protein
MLEAERTILILMTMVRRPWPHAQHGDELFFHLLLKNIMGAGYIHTSIHTGTSQMASDPTHVTPENASKQGGIRELIITCYGGGSPLQPIWWSRPLSSMTSGKAWSGHSVALKAPSICTMDNAAESAAFSISMVWPIPSKNVAISSACETFH